MATTRAPTDQELQELPSDGHKYEVVDGELVRMSPAGLLHERVISALMGYLVPFVRERGLGVVLSSNTMHVLPSGNLRSPDLSCVAAGRLPREIDGPFPALAPDLAVEVVSPYDRPRAMLDKVGEYLQAGVRLVWIIDPRARTATVHRSLTDVEALDEAACLEGGEVVPGFRCDLAAILGPRARRGPNPRVPARST